MMFAHEIDIKVKILLKAHSPVMVLCPIGTVGSGCQKCFLLPEGQQRICSMDAV